LLNVFKGLPAISKHFTSVPLVVPRPKHTLGNSKAGDTDGLLFSMPAAAAKQLAI
jgi:hypothetical protein